ncbi:MAG: PQQ-binding-like beta-propeller repeat protein [Bacteroidota bacterium]
MKIKSTVYFSAFVISFFIESTKFTPVYSQDLNSLQIDFGTIPSVTLPLDIALKHRFKIKNIGTANLIFDLEARVIETNQEAVTFPQPPVLYLAPAEEIEIACILDAATGNLSTLPVGQHTRTVKYKFINHINNSDSISVTAAYSFTVIDKNDITGSYTVRGKVVDENGTPIPNVQMNLDTGADFSLPNGTNNNGEFNYSVPYNTKWMIKASKEGYNDAYQFVDLNQAVQYQIVLTRAKFYNVNFQTKASINTEFGFWQGAVSDDESKILLTQGMEIWYNENLRTESKLFLYKPDGTKLWEHPMGYESWGISISRDGNYAAYAQKHITQPKIVMLETSSPTVLWEKDFDTQNFPTGSFFIGHNSNEIRISNTNKYVGLGSGEGDFYLLDLQTGNLLWAKFVAGQVRNVRFSGDDNYVYIGSDPWLYKVNTADGAVVWKSYIYSWPLHYGLQLSPDESLIASMVKSGEITVINTSDGSKAWDFDPGVIGQWLEFSRDGKQIAASAFGGVWVFDAATGKPSWRVKGTKAGYFSKDNNYLLLFNELYTKEGTRIYMLPQNQGGQFAFINENNTSVVLATGQMYSSGVGLVFYEGTVTDVEQENSLPQSFSLEQNYPNPFNPSTTIEYTIPNVETAYMPSHVTLKIYNILGQEVATLVNEQQLPGKYSVQFGVETRHGASLPSGIAAKGGYASGVYFYKLKSGEFSEVRKMILLK